MDFKQERFRARVWISGTKDDFDRWFREISRDLLCKYPCDFYSRYTCTQESKEDNPFFFSKMHLLVLIVTQKLLGDLTCSAYQEIISARRLGIPILPIVVDQISVPLYKERLGNLQFLDRTTFDETAITYGIKLNSYLAKTFPSSVAIQDIYSCFSTHIFLSYRKKDRRFASRLMQIIHSDPKYAKTIGLFYDELLQPGEFFDEELAQQIVNCDVFVMLVTPNILKRTINEQGHLEDNYIVSNEYPLAVQCGKPIIPVEFQDKKGSATNKKQLNTKCPNIGSCVILTDEPSSKQLLSRLGACLDPRILRKTFTSQENYLIGLAYIYGISVEVDRSRGIQFVTEAAAEGHQDAVSFLEHLYAADSGLHKDILHKALENELRLIKIYKHSHIPKEDEFVLLYELGEAYLSLSNPFDHPAQTIIFAVNRAKTYLEKAIAISKVSATSYTMKKMSCYALVLYSQVISDDRSKLSFLFRSIDLASSLVKEHNNADAQAFLVEIYGYACSQYAPPSLNKRRQSQVAIEEYGNFLSGYISALAALLKMTNDKRHLRRLLDIIYRAAAFAKANDDLAQAISLYEQSIELACLYKNKRVAGALYLSQIYSENGETDLAEKYTKIYLDSTAGCVFPTD